MDVIGNNIANVSTTGFKSSRVDFADSFSQTLQASSSGDGTVSGTPAMQVGSGVVLSAIKNDYNQGSIVRTGYQTDLTVSGEGFFLVRDVVSEFQFATRAGDFRLDENGYLATNTGLHVQGFADSGLTTRGDIKIDATQRPAGADPNAAMVSFSIDSEGRIEIKLFARGQVVVLEDRFGIRITELLGKRS